MKPGLSQFFDQMADYFANPARAEVDARQAIYGRFVVGHVEAAVRKVYPLVRASLSPEEWDTLLTAYYATRPARHFEPNRAAEPFAAFLADRIIPERLLPWLPALARFEWADFEVYACEEEIPEQVDALTPNPTLQALQHGWRIAEWVRAGPSRPAAPELGDETVLFWRHPRTHRTIFLAADERALLVLKIALEELDVSRVAAEGGLAEAELRRLIAAFARDGMVLSP